MIRSTMRLLPAIAVSLTPAWAGFANLAIVLDIPLAWTSTADHVAGLPGVAVWGGVNWAALAAEDDLDGDGAIDDIIVLGLHLVAPHLAEIAPNPLLVTVLLNAIPGGAGQFNTDAIMHPKGEHWDNLAATHAAAAGGGSVLGINMTHTDFQHFQQFPDRSRYRHKIDQYKYQLPGYADAIPEPSTWTLMAAGLGLAALGKWRKRPAA